MRNFVNERAEVLHRVLGLHAHLNRIVNLLPGHNLTVSLLMFGYIGCLRYL